MFRDMRRKRQKLSDDESIRILETMTNGVLAVQGDNDYPYAVPISYVYHDGHIYMHSALSGHKIDGMHRNEKVSFCVIEKDDVVDKEFTTYFRSVIVFGKVCFVKNDEDKIRILRLLAAKYSPDIDEHSTTKEIEKGLRAINIIDLNIEYMTGKEAIELVRIRNEENK